MKKRDSNKLAVQRHWADWDERRAEQSLLAWLQRAAWLSMGLNTGAAGTMLWWATTASTPALDLVTAIVGSCSLAAGSALVITTGRHQIVQRQHADPWRRRGASLHEDVQAITQQHVERLDRKIRDGVALGGIYELALACRGIIATEKSTIGFPEIRLNIFPGLGGTQRMPRRSGLINANDPVSGDAVDRVDPLVRSRGGEIGIRTSGARGFRSSASLWVLDLDSELLFVGDAGTTEPQGRTRRTGVTVASFWQPYRALTVDADVSFTRARFVDEPIGVQSVAGALNNVIAAGITWAPVARGPFASLRVRHLGG